MILKKYVMSLEAALTAVLRCVRWDVATFTCMLGYPKLENMVLKIATSF